MAPTYPDGGATEGAGSYLKVLERDVPWETYMQARLITDRDLERIRRYDKKNPVTKADVLAKDGKAYVETFFNVLRNVTKEETVQYTLALLREMLEMAPSGTHAHASYVHALSSLNPYTQLLKLLQRADWTTQELAAVVLAILIDTRPDRTVPLSGPASTDLISGASTSSEVKSALPDAVLSAFVDFVANQLRRPTDAQRSHAVAAHCLALVLKEVDARDLCVRKGVVQLLAPLVANPRRADQTRASVQLQYEASMCYWQLSFYKKAAEAMVAAGVVGKLVDLLRYAQSVKVARVCVLALKSMAGHGDHRFLEAMVEAGLKKVVATKMEQECGDEEITNALDYLKTEMEERGHELSSFDKYKREVLSGSLAWTPIHTEPQFWLQNVNHFDDKDYLVFRALMKLLEQSSDATTLAVGCHDLAEFIQHHPKGRQLAHELGAKEVVMRKLEHHDPEVQRNALFAFQRILMSKQQLNLAAKVVGA